MPITVPIQDLWYKNAIIYQLNVESFQDGNGDGIGDFEGLTSRLGYLAGLGVTCLWLHPFYTSPRRDDGYEKVNVEAQQIDPNSLLSKVERMIRLRKEHPEFGQGEWEVIDTGEPAVFALRASWKNSSTVAVHNFSGSPCRVRLKLAEGDARHLIDILGGKSFAVPEGGACEIGLDGYGFRWLRLGGGR